MNMHVAQQETYLQRLHREHKERQERIAKAARNPPIKEEPQIKIIHVTDSARRAEERARQLAIMAEHRRKREARNRERAKEQWRASWRYMIQLADNRQQENNLISLADIIVQTATKYGVEINDIKSQRRQRQVCQARFEVCWRAKRETRLSLPQIGRGLGGRDHTTVLHAVRQYEAIRQEVLGNGKAYSNDAQNAKFIAELVITESM